MHEKADKENEETKQGGVQHNLLFLLQTIIDSGIHEPGAIFCLIVQM